jgi:hypothetical protein
MQMSVPGIDTGVESAATRAETSSHRRRLITITDRKGHRLIRNFRGTRLNNPLGTPETAFYQVIQEGWALIRILTGSRMLVISQLQTAKRYSI